MFSKGVPIWFVGIDAGGQIMDVKQAVMKAAEYVASLESIGTDINTDEDPFGFLTKIDFAVEGAHYSEGEKQWHIEVGFVRKWDRSQPTVLSGISSNPISNTDKRTYKEVSISDTDGCVKDYGPVDSY